jgi:hypothetical protein
MTMQFSTLFLIFASVIRADNFTFPEDDTPQPSTPDPIYQLGEPQQFTWTTSASSVTLILLQNDSDATETLASK